MQKHLSLGVWCDRSVQLREAYLPWLRHRHPKGSVVMINLLTGGYVVGGNGAETMELYAERFGDADWCLDTVHVLLRPKSRWRARR